ncbi:MAG: VWA domain-containing protein [Phycisphaerae bacterium]
MSANESERLRRWRLILSRDAEEDLGGLSGEDLEMDRVLGQLYDTERQAGLGGSSPRVNRWLGDIRKYFPTATVRVMQKDALERLNLTQMLLQPEMLEAVEPDVHLVATLLTLSRVIPNKTRDTARQVVRKVVEELQRKLANPLIQAVRGSLNRATRTNRPRVHEIDWHRTIRANLNNYLHEQRTIVPERLIGYGHKRPSLRDVVLCVDQSGSMGTSVVYSGIFGAVLASMPAIKTRMVVFDTSVVDLTEELQDPVDLLFGTQLGGGTDINRALTYCEGLIARPHQTVFVLITDLYEGGDAEGMLRRVAAMVESGVTFVCLLALNDDGAPMYNDHLAARLAASGVPSFACTPELFPDLMAAAISRQDLTLWASRYQITTAGRRG